MISPVLCVILPSLSVISLSTNAPPATGQDESINSHIPPTAFHDEVIKDNQHSANANGDEYHQQEQEMAMEQQHQQLVAILICNADIGNAEPTRESFGAWVPSDGGFFIARGGGGDKREMTKNHVCCCSVVDDNNVNDDDNNINQQKQKTKFDIIVIGMQEATFIIFSTNSSNNNQKWEDYEDGSSNAKNLKQCAGAGAGAADVVVDTRRRVSEGCVWGNDRSG